MRIFMPLTRVEIYYRDEIANIRFVREINNRCYYMWHKTNRRGFQKFLARCIFRFGEHKFRTLSTGTWVYFWEINND